MACVVDGCPVPRLASSPYFSEAMHAETLFGTHDGQYDEDDSTWTNRYVDAAIMQLLEVSGYIKIR